MQKTARPWVVLVGGFLGAGKTTLILAAAQELERRGVRSAMIWNDQGRDLVDRRYADQRSAPSGEVTGGCFCCLLSELVEALDSLRAHAPEVIFAEPVGSCTDIAATVLRPLSAYRDVYQLAPLSVLVDPSRARALLSEDGNPEMRFLFEKQLQEADLVCFTKSDEHPDYPETGAAHVRQLSARTGQGVAAWLDEVLSGAIGAAGMPLEIDYRAYAQAEAALAWMNLRATFEPPGMLSPAMLLGPLLDGLDAALTAKKIPISHLKGIVSGPTGFVKAAICANGQEPVVDGDLQASPSGRLDLILNLRALADPEPVREIVEREMSRFASGLIDYSIDCFSPAPPVPEQRIPIAG
jgi:hypothetical protein